MAFLLDRQMPLTSLEPSRRRLVLSVIEEFHGPIVATVAEVLMRSEKTTLPDLTRLVQRDQGIMGVSRAGKTKTKVTIPNVKEALLIMVQHNMVMVTMPTEKELRRAKAASVGGTFNIRLYYSLQPLDVLLRSRGPHFHAHASSKLGKVAGMIVGCFMRHGRRTLPDIKEELLSRARAASARAGLQDYDSDAEGKEEDEEVTVDKIQKTFEEMVMAKYVDKVKKLDLVTPGVEPEKAKKPSMTFAKIPAAVKGEGGANGEASGANGGGNVQNAELAARQEKAAKQTNARKRRLLGHHGSTGSGSAGGGDLADTDDEDEDELPVEMQGLSMSSVTGQHEPSNANRLPPAKRLKRSSSSSTAASNGDRKTAPARTRGRGRGRSLRGGKGRAASGKGKGKGKANGARLDMDDVFHEEGSDEGDDEGVAGGLAGARGAGAGATVLDTVVWKLGIDRFHRDFRQIALLGLVQDRFPKSKLAYMAMKLMMENSAPTERKVNQETTASISATELFDKLCKVWPTDPLTRNKAVPDWRRFVSWMSALCSDLTAMVSKISGADPQNPRYVVKMADMIRYMQKTLIRCTVRDKYGAETGRIMEILLQKKYLEQQQVGEMAMIPAGDARTRLYCLLKDRMVSVQEVPRRADRNPNTTYYLWTIKHDQVSQVVMDSLYKAMLNMRLRRKFVYSNDKELFIHDAAARVSNDAERERLEKVKRSLDRLDTALLRLDENLMIFDTF